MTGNSVEDDRIPSEQEIAFDKKMIEKITECCSSLIDEFPGIYDMRKEDLVRLVVVGVIASLDVR